VESDSATAHELVDELGDKLLGVLVRTIDIVSTSNDDGHTKRAMIGFGQELSTGLGGGIGIGRLQHCLLIHGFLIESLLTINLISAHVDKALNAMNLGTLEKDVSSHNIVLSELKGISKGVVDVSLSSEMHNSINLLILQHEVDQIGAANVALDELVVGIVLDLIQVLQARAIWLTRRAM